MPPATSCRAENVPALSFAALLLAHAWIAPAHGAERSVGQTSAELSATFGTVDAASNSNKSAQVDVRVTVPVATSFGASLQGYFADTNIQVDMPTDLVGTTSCSYEALGGSGTVFFRHPLFGRVGASISSANLESTCGGKGFFLAGNSDSLRSTGYSLAAEYYFPVLTLAAERTVSSYAGNDDLISDVVSASWYPLADLSISPNVGRINGRDQYGVSIEHQPDFLGRSASIALSFGSQSLDGDSIRSASLSFTYHFGLHVDLKTRDRQFR